MTRARRRLVLALQAGAILTLACQAHARPWLLWNATASAPVGLYAVQPEARPRVGELLVVSPGPALAGWMVERGYIGRNVPLVKRVAAVAGAQVCRVGGEVSIDGRPAAMALSRDHLERPLPGWSGCRTLEPTQIFLLNAAPASLDGRYFGPTSAAAVVGRAVPVWLQRGR